MTTKEFQEEFDSMKGQMVLYDDKVYHWIGIGEDDHDFIYILINRDKFMFGTPIAGVAQLKDKIYESFYKNLVHTARYNWHYSFDHWSKRNHTEEEFNEMILEERKKLHDRIIEPKGKTLFDCGDNRIIGELYWEFK